MNFTGELERISKLQNGWDSYGADAPNTLSITLANNVLEYFIPHLLASHIGPSTSGGIGITFRSDFGEAFIEILNTGETHVVYAKNGEDGCETFKITLDPESIEHLFYDISLFLLG